MKTVVPTFERAFNLDADVIFLFLSKDCGVQGSEIPPLSHRAPSAGCRYRFCGTENENDWTVAIGEDEAVFWGLMWSTFRPSNHSKLAKSKSLCNGKTQLSSGLLELSGSVLNGTVAVVDLLEPSNNGAVAWAGGRTTCDELEKRLMLETSLGHCCGHLLEP